MVGPDVFSIERVPFKRGTNSLGFRGSVPFGTPPSLKPRFLVGQRKLEKVGENRDQEKSFIFMGPSTNLDSTVQRRGLPNKIRTNSPRYIYIYTISIKNRGWDRCFNFRTHAFIHQVNAVTSNKTLFSSKKRVRERNPWLFVVPIGDYILPSIHGKYYEIAELIP